MTDIVGQLKFILADYPGRFEVTLTVPSGLLRDALEEIERLRAARDMGRPVPHHGSGP